MRICFKLIKTVQYLLLRTFVMLPLHVYGQTCCSGGVPLSGNLGMPQAQQGTWQFSLSYDLNQLKTLKDGRRTLDDLTRIRSTHAVMLETGYSISERLSADVFFSLVRQEREIRPIDLPSTFVSTQHIGDAVLLLKYQLFKGANLGFGVKAPTGPSDLRRDDGIPLAADLQPGSGSWDGILWGSFSKQLLSSRPTLTVFGTTTYRLTGKNDTYLEVQTYEFGNEFQTIAGVSDQVAIGNTLLNPSVSFRYRQVAQDRNNGEFVPATGGQWLFINPGVTYPLSTAVGIQANLELPIFSEVRATQLTPTYRINAGIQWALAPKASVEKPLIR